MPEMLDRALQREFLTDVKQLFPASADLKDTREQEDYRKLLVNVIYLHEHGLIECKWQTFTSGDIRLYSAKITAKGLDFLADDGGLSAILGVVTVRFETETIKAS